MIYDTDGHAEITGNQPKPIVIEDDVFFRYGLTYLEIS